MRNVDLHLTSDITLRVRHLSGTLKPVGERGIANLDDQNSYGINVTAGEVAMDLPSLNAVVSHALGSGRSNVRNLRLTIEDGTLRQKGTIDKAIDIPFNSRGTVGLTPDGRIRVHSESVKGFGVPVKPLLKIFGVQMDDLLHVAPDTGVTTDGNDLLLDPSRLMPPPVIRGRVTAVRIEGQSLVQVMGTGPDRPLDPPASSPKSHSVAWRPDQLRQAHHVGKRPRSDRRGSP